MKTPPRSGPATDAIPHMPPIIWMSDPQFQNSSSELHTHLSIQKRLVFYEVALHMSAKLNVNQPMLDNKNESLCVVCVLRFKLYMLHNNDNAPKKGVEKLTAICQDDD